MAAAPRLKVLLFADEADIHLNPHRTAGWYLRGTPRPVPAAGTNQRRGIYGALAPYAQRLLAHTTRDKSAEGFVEFLRALLRTYRHLHILLVLDNGPIHTAKIVTAFLGQHAERITPLWLPKYSPNLNLIERVWGHLKRAALANVFFRTPARLLVAIHRAIAAFNCRRGWFSKIHFGKYSQCQGKAA